MARKKYKLPKTFTKLWLEALRSGVYEQTGSQLCRIQGTRVGFCCLGVAENIMGQDYKLMNTEGWGVSETIKEEGKESFVPEELQRSYYEGGSWSTKKSLVGILASMNDDGKTFNEIADWIEENVELY